ncbi:MAG: signal peptidase I [Spirochaetes bacterium]|nr:signal peptidase I [Spirochaetota bacterium]
MYSIYRPDDKNKDKTPGLLRVIFLSAGLIAGFLLMRIFFTSYKVTGISMEPSYKAGDFIILFRLFKTDINTPVLVKSPVEKDRYYFLRIAAKGGDTVQMINKQLYVNGNLYQPGSKITSDDIRIFPGTFTPRDNSEKIIIPQKHVFLLGDNIDRSYDSRYFGPVAEKNITGKVLLNF